jgi:hypothetical protein
MLASSSEAPIVTSGPVIEAEAYEASSLFEPFEIQASGATTYITVPGSGGTMDASDSGPGQAHYTFTALATNITIFATVSLPGDLTDSFWWQITGLSDWAAQNGRQTTGFEEIILGTVTGAVIGQTYTFKVQRREAGVQLDRFQLVEGLFVNGIEDPDPTPDPDPNALPLTGCSNSSWMFCEDFESYTTGTVPSGTNWTIYGNSDNRTNYDASGEWSIETSIVRATSGEKSAHFHVDSQGRAFINTTKPFPLKAFYGRMMMYMDKLPGTAHFDFVSAYGGNNENNGNYVWGGQFGHIIANYHPGDCPRHYNNLIPKTKVWQCVEWKFDGNINEMELWIDDINQTGANHAVITNGQNGNGCGNWAAPSMFDTMSIGWAHYQQQDVGNDTWIDDLVIDDQRIGCDPVPQ